MQKKIDDIQDTKQREQAVIYKADENSLYAAHRHESNNIFHLANQGIEYALAAGKFNYV